MSKSLRRLLAVWGLLLVLLALTVTSLALPLGPVAPVATYGFAFAKAMLIAWVFMRLSAECGLCRLMAISAIAWVSVLIVLIALDFAGRVAG